MRKKEHESKITHLTCMILCRDHAEVLGMMANSNQVRSASWGRGITRATSEIVLSGQSAVSCGVLRKQTFMTRS